MLNEAVSVLDLQRLTGHTISNILAIPALRVWTRALYREIAITLEQNCTRVVLNTNSRDELTEIIRLLDTKNGAHICIAALPIDSVFIDASECGYGGKFAFTNFYGPLPEALIGKSSTLRELAAVETVLQKTIDKGIQLPKRLLLCLDSNCAVRNLEKGGGPIKDLCDIVKRIFILCELIGTEIFPLWIPRDY